ncbi:MAG: hypothetical protein QOG73_403, partial [Acetobacteraceae bacterium]|nr:hypothetical protein [Acetobacteraceae bacterium]
MWLQIAQLSIAGFAGFGFSVNLKAHLLVPCGLVVGGTTRAGPS